MLFKKNKEISVDEYMRNWPESYYGIVDARTKEACLKKRLEADPENKEDKRRLELLYRRYGKYPDENRDSFFHAWTLIKAAGRGTVNVLNRKMVEKEFYGYMNELFLASFDRDELVEQEWKQFAERFIELSGNSPAYRSSLLGLTKVSDTDTAFRMANDIIFITRTVPRQFSCEKEFNDLAEIMEKTFIGKIEKGDEIMAAVKLGKSHI